MDPAIEIYFDRCPGQFNSDELAILHEGWQKVASILKEIGIGKIAMLEVMEFTFLNDVTMAEVHRDFLSDETPTDVITFEHGEILIGIEVAKRQGLQFEQDFLRELALYGIHGMLHLSGFDDRTPDEAKGMKIRQEELLDVYFPIAD
ncbi:MAG: rRNA maturation RNase YbeY [Akkermansiaceae bacterium]|jgi:probable rRNA maturation factor